MVDLIHYPPIMTNKQYHSLYQFTARYVHHVLVMIACSLTVTGPIPDPSISRPIRL